MKEKSVEGREREGRGRDERGVLSAPGSYVKLKRGTCVAYVLQLFTREARTERHRPCGETGMAKLRAEDGG